MQTQTLNRGAVALIAAGTLDELSVKLGCSTRALTTWRNSRCIPSRKFQAILAEKLGISAGLWYLESDVALPAQRAVEPTPAELAQWQATTESIRALLRRSDLTIDARVALEQLGNAVARDVLRVSQPRLLPRYAPPLPK